MLGNRDMKPYKKLFEVTLPPISQIAGKEDIDKWTDDQAEREIDRLRSFISRVKMTGDDQSVQDEVRRSYDAINRIERIKFPDRYAKKQASKDRAKTKALNKRRDDFNAKASKDEEDFNSASEKEQANYILNRIESSIRITSDNLKRSRPELRKPYRNEIEKLKRIGGRGRTTSRVSEC